MSPMSGDSPPTRAVGVVTAQSGGQIVLRLEWNALRVGDRVLVHDDACAVFTVWDGEVTLVQTRAPTNEVAVRGAGAASPHAVVRPRRSAVHLATLDPNERCWRCDISSDRRAADVPGVVG